MRLLPSIPFGTERYPEKVARRLRSLNIAVWIAAATHAGYAFVLFFDSTLRWLTVLNLVGAVLYAGVPLLHRLGRLAGPLAFITLFYADMFVFISLIGTGIGIQFYFLLGAALTVLYLGTEYVALTSASGAVAAALIIVVQVMVPYDTGLLPATVFYLSVIINAVVSCGALLLIVFYALREAARAEAIAQFEHERSESLLANILPAPIAERLKSNPGSIADSFSEATILFVDIVGFTKLSESMTPEDLVDLQQSLFRDRRPNREIQS
jgi:adenylate cyclase